MKHRIHIKRIYEQPDEKDGYRILVDRLWPRGVKKESAKLDEWNKEVAPSPALRIWFDHKAEHFERFSELYRQELAQKMDELVRIRQISDQQHVTLLYAARDPEINHANVILSVLETIS